MKEFVCDNAIVIISVIAAINLITFILYGVDKSRAKRHAWRIPEATLLGFAAIFGSVGAILGMSVFRHKTKHLKFVITVPLLLVIQLGLVVIFYFKYF